RIARPLPLRHCQPPQPWRRRAVLNEIVSRLLRHATALPTGVTRGPAGEPPPLQLWRRTTRGSGPRAEPAGETLQSKTGAYSDARCKNPVLKSPSAVHLGTADHGMQVDQPHHAAVMGD